MAIPHIKEINVNRSFFIVFELLLFFRVQATKMAFLLCKNSNINDQLFFLAPPGFSKNYFSCLDFNFYVIYLTIIP